MRKRVSQGLVLVSCRRTKRCLLQASRLSTNAASVQLVSAKSTGAAPRKKPNGKQRHSPSAARMKPQSVPSCMSRKLENDSCPSGALVQRIFRRRPSDGRNSLGSGLNTSGAGPGIAAAHRPHQPPRRWRLRRHRRHHHHPATAAAGRRPRPAAPAATAAPTGAAQWLPGSSAFEVQAASAASPRSPAAGWPGFRPSVHGRASCAALRPAVKVQARPRRPGRFRLAAPHAPSVAARRG